MPDETAIRERIRRAREREAEAVFVSGHPIIVEVDSEHSGRTHTVVPEALYCSCEDARYRDVICWHLIWLARQDNVAGDALESRIRDALDAVEEDIERTRDHLDEIEDDAEQLTAVADALEDESDQEATSVVDQLKEVSDESVDESEYEIETESESEDTEAESENTEAESEDDEPDGLADLFG